MLDLENQLIVNDQSRNLPLQEKDIPPPPTIPPPTENIPPPPPINMTGINPAEDKNRFINALISHGFEKRKLKLLNQDDLTDIAELIRNANFDMSKNAVILSIHKKIDSIYQPINDRKYRGGMNKKSRRTRRRRRK